MKTYSLSFAASITHQPEHPERTASKAVEWDVVYQVWPSRAAMLKTIDMQDKSASHRAKWRACKAPASAGH